VEYPLMVALSSFSLSSLLSLLDARRLSQPVEVVFSDMLRWRLPTDLARNRV